MLALERHREILQELEREGSARVSSLASRLGVTEETIRRDLDKLEEEGQLIRSHGGAVPARPSDSAETPDWWRETSQEKEKEAIAREALKRIQAGDRVLFDASTTAWHMSKLMDDQPCTVITNSTKVTMTLADRKRIDVITLGGTLAKNSLSLVGPVAANQLETYHAHSAFLSCRGLDVEQGVSDTTELQAQIRKTMMQQADKKILLIDHSKFDVRALTCFAEVQEFDEIITDDNAPKDNLAEIENRGVKVTQVR